MTSKTKSTVKMLCVRSDAVMRKELPEEAQKLLDLYNDPNVAPEQKTVVRAELDKAIRELEERVTTRRLNEARSAGSQPPVP
jgi:hypothetical protein